MRLGYSNVSPKRNHAVETQFCEARRRYGVCGSRLCESGNPGLLACAFRAAGLGQSSLQKGAAGNPAALVRLQVGLSAEVEEDCRQPSMSVELRLA